MDHFCQPTSSSNIYLRLLQISLHKIPPIPWSTFKYISLWQIIIIDNYRIIIEYTFYYFIHVAYLFQYIYFYKTKSKSPNMFSNSLLYIFLQMLFIFVTPKILLRIFLSKLAKLVPISKFKVHPSEPHVRMSLMKILFIIISAFLDDEFLNGERMNSKHCLHYLCFLQFNQFNLFFS